MKQEVRYSAAVNTCNIYRNHNPDPTHNPNLKLNLSIDPTDYIMCVVMFVTKVAVPISVSIALLGTAVSLASPLLILGLLHQPVVGNSRPIGVHKQTYT